jgi:hypothetical protein
VHVTLWPWKRRDEDEGGMVKGAGENRITNRNVFVYSSG